MNRFHAGEKVQPSHIGLPMMDKEEKFITPDQYDKLMRRLHILEQKIAILGDSHFKATEIDQVFERQYAIEKQLKRIDKMFVKIGTALFRKATNEAKA